MSQDHYLKAVTELSQSHKMIAASDIHSPSGIKLIAAGVEITNKMLDRLSQHKLIPNLDQALSMENMLNSESIYLDAIDLLNGSDKLIKAIQSVDKTNSFRSVIAAISLPTPLLFKLTVAKEKYSHIYQHSLLLMIISVYLAHRDGMKTKELEEVATASLFQDIGMMHIDPDLLKPSYVMSPLERRHLYAHPLTGFLLISEFPEISKSVANAILEHHERMDGSGYPRGINGESISRYGQILSITEIIAKAFDEEGQRLSWKDVDVILKLNSKKFGAGLVSYLDVFFDDLVEASSDQNESENLIEQIRVIAKLFSDFNHVTSSQNNNKIFEYSKSRLIELQVSLFSAGIDPRDPEQLIEIITSDPEAKTDYIPIINETIWQFRSLLMDISRLFPEIHQPSGELNLNGWLTQMKLTLMVLK